MKNRKKNKKVELIKNIISIVFYFYIMLKMISYGSKTTFESVQASIVYICLFMIVVINYTKKIEKI